MLPERADVIVSDVHGALPIFGRGLESLHDAHRRFLKDGGILLPARDRIWTAAADLPAEAYGRAAVWSDGRWGVDLSPGTRFGVDCPFSTAVEPSHLRTEPACIASIEHAAEAAPTIGGAATLKASCAGFANGYALWFDAELFDGVCLTSAPGEQVGVYPRKFAPWTRPVNSEPLRRRAPAYRPRLNDKGEAERLVLQLMDGGRGLDEIAREVTRRFPQVFRDEDVALQTVANLSDEFSS